jgi:two-component sensor histidine kinase
VRAVAGAAAGVNLGRDAARSGSPTRRVVAIVLAFWLLVAALFGYLLVREYRNTFGEAALLAGALASLLAEQAGRMIATAAFIHEQVIALAGPSGTPLPRDRASHERLVTLTGVGPFIQSVWLGDAAGDAVLTSRVHPPPRVNAADRDYYQMVRDYPNLLFIGLLPDNRFEDQVLITTSRRIEPIDGPFRGFVQVALSPDYLNELYARLDIGYETVFWLLNRDRRPLLRQPPRPIPELLAVPTETVFSELIAQQGTARLTGPLGGTEQVFAARTDASSGLSVLVGIRSADVAARWRRQAAGLISAAMVLMLMAAAAGWVVLQRFKQDREFTALLEGRVRERTAELERTTAQLEDALAHRELLVREVNHRVKNSLQLVASLLSLQSRRIEDPAMTAALAEARSRVQTIAKVHERFYRTSRIGTVELVSFLAELCASIGESLGSASSAGAIEVSGTELIVPMDLATPVAIIVNELVTNAVKHAYPDGETGPINVIVSHDAARIDIEVRDAGRGLVEEHDPAGRRTLGLTVVGALTRQLRGTWRIEDAAPGTSIVIELPRAAALEPEEG